MPARAALTLRLAGYVYPRQHGAEAHILVVQQFCLKAINEPPSA